MPKFIETTHTWDGFLDWCENTPAGQTWKDSDEDTSAKTDPDSWIMEETGGVTYEQTLDVARYGWPEGLKEVTAIETEHANLFEDRASQGITMDVRGFIPIVPNLLAGFPENMLNIEPVYRPEPIIKIVVNPYANWTIEKRKFIEYGCAIMGLIDSIEADGISVEMDMAYCIASKHSKRNIKLTVNIKTAGQPLDRDRIIFALAHPCTFRRFVFRWIEQDENYESHSMGHGRPASGKDVPKDKTALNMPSLEDTSSQTFPERLKALKKLYAQYCVNHEMGV
jgi:hypothetical protein